MRIVRAALCAALLGLASPALAQRVDNGVVTSVSNSDGTLTISPVTGNVVVSLNLNHANTWTGQQTFVAPIVTTSFTATGLVTLADLATQAANTVLVNATAGVASPTAQAVSSCSGTNSALTWTTNTGFGCSTTIQTKETLATKTSNYPIVSGDSGTIFDNTGAVGEVDFTLPSYAAGLKYCFTVAAAQTLKVIAPASNKIAIGTTNSATAGNVTANAVYSTLCLYATSVSNQWAAKSLTGGPWTVN